ncbi:hypothetical protein [Saccharopolyspora sp. 5N708]|uniref:hypothetical protein n=1 Tax=Saccharopolyspora sp. 5N708 TaxID=3457424 RepID=UPI003FD3A048
MLLAAAGIALFALIDGSNGVVLVVIGMAVASFGMGPQGVLCTEMVVSSVPPQRAGAASAISETGGEFGIAMGIALFGSIGSAVYRNVVAIAPQVPPHLAAEAADGLPGAVTSAAQLADPLSVLEPARGAFTSGLHVVSLAGATVVALFAIVGMVALRKRPRPVAEPAITEREPWSSHAPQRSGGAGSAIRWPSARSWALASRSSFSGAGSRPNRSS